MTPIQSECMLEPSSMDSNKLPFLVKKLLPGPERMRPSVFVKIRIFVYGDS